MINKYLIIILALAIPAAFLLGKSFGEGREKNKVSESYKEYYETHFKEKQEKLSDLVLEHKREVARKEEKISSLNTTLSLLQKQKQRGLDKVLDFKKEPSCDYFNDERRSLYYEIFNSPTPD